MKEISLFRKIFEDEMIRLAKSDIPVLNTVHFETFTQAFDYMWDINGFGFSQPYLHNYLRVAMRWSLINSIISTIYWRTNHLKSKKLYIFIMLVAMIFSLLFIALLIFVSDSYNKNFILKDILLF